MFVLKLMLGPILLTFLAERSIQFKCLSLYAVFNKFADKIEANDPKYDSKLDNFHTWMDSKDIENVLIDVYDSTEERMDMIIKKGATDEKEVGINQLFNFPALNRMLTKDVRFRIKMEDIFEHP